MKPLHTLFLIIFTTILLSCSEDENDFIDISTNSKIYPEQFTAANWREFIGAPKEVMDRVSEQIKKEDKSKEIINYPDLTPESFKNAPNSTDFSFGKIQVILPDGGTSYLGNTLVEITKDSITTAGISTFSPFFGDSNFLLNKQTGVVCYFHKRKKDGQFTYQEWVSGVTIADAIVILNHLNQNIVFDKLWQYTAADMDANGRVDEEDVQTLLDLVTGVVEELPDLNGNTNQPVIYLTQHEYHEFQSDVDFWLPYASFFYTFPDCRGFGPNLVNLDRYAVKRGDLNGSWNLMD